MMGLIKGQAGAWRSGRWSFYSASGVMRFQGWITGQAGAWRSGRWAFHPISSVKLTIRTVRGTTLGLAGHAGARRSVGPILVLAVLFAGCTENVLFQEDAQTPNGVWERNWNPTFSFDVTDTVNTHDVYLDLRHTGDYPFSNLYAFVTLTAPDSTRLVDTVECTLADPTGRWYGRGQGFISSDRFQAHVLYKLRNKFPRAGRYSLTLEQAMRVEKLEGIIDVGVSVERSKGG